MAAGFGPAVFAIDRDEVRSGLTTALSTERKYDSGLCALGHV